MNPSLIKSSTNIPGISDPAIIITDMETKPHYQKTTPRKRFTDIYSKANWNKVKENFHFFSFLCLVVKSLFSFYHLSYFVIYPW
jgi:hypothetical protein